MIPRRARNIGKAFSDGPGKWRSLRITQKRRSPASRKPKRIRYALVGLGHIAQVAVLPAFRHASKNSELRALVSSDSRKLRELARRYRVPIQAAYEDYDGLLRSGEIDAVYLALPNSMHCDFTIRAAKAGVHVLCEKPLAVSEAECKRMIDACERHSVKLMTAYRLHFEKANLEAIRIAQSGKLGKLRFFISRTVSSRNANRNRPAPRA